MPHRAVQRAFEETSRESLVPHDSYLTDRRTGVLQLVWRIDRQHPVVLGAGRYGIAEEKESVRPRRVRIGRKTFLQPPGPPTRHLVAQIVRRGEDQIPVLPGSSIKGAVRQVYELLTPSCDFDSRQSCRVRPRETQARLCPACSLFGAPGYGGRLAFGEAEPGKDDWQRQLLTVEVPTAWAPRPRRPKPGTVRTYGQGPALTQDGALAPEEEKTQAVWGTFRSRIRVINASEEELGLLLLALGLGACSPRLRVGGKKFHGFGAIDPELVEVSWRFPRPERFTAEAARVWAEELVTKALGEEARRESWEALHAALSLGG